MNAQMAIDTGRNRLLLAGFLALQLLQLVLLPVVLLPRNDAWAWLLLLPLLLTNSWWAYMHEALHGHLFANRKLGRAAGRINAILYGAAFDLLRFGHLLHHAYSRTRRERAEVYRAGEDNLIAVNVAYYFRLLGGLYVFEVLGSVVFLLPRALIRGIEARTRSADNVLEELAPRLLAPVALAAVRTDALAILLVYGMSFHCYGAHWWLLALALWGRGLLISLLDNAFHYGTPLDSPHYAPDLSAPEWWGRLLLHFNLHGLHHRQPAAPWHELPRLHRREAGTFQGSLFRTILSQFRGPIAEHRLLKD
jgi:fatty acid desaturase